MKAARPVIATWENAEAGDTIGKPKGAKHTPGPWIVRESIDAGRRPVLLIDGRHGVRNVADILVSEREQDEANARLIAAAPDLLAACEAMLREHDEWDCAAAEAARAAIAKARGAK